MFLLKAFALFALVALTMRSIGATGAHAADYAQSVSQEVKELEGGARARAFFKPGFTRKKLGGGEKPSVPTLLIDAASAQRGAVMRGSPPGGEHDPVRIGDHRPEAPPSQLNQLQAKAFAKRRAEALGVPDTFGEVRDETLPPGAIVNRDGAVLFNYADSGRPCGAGGAGCVRL